MTDPKFTTDTCDTFGVELELSPDEIGRLYTSVCIWRAAGSPSVEELESRDEYWCDRDGCAKPRVTTISVARQPERE